MTDPRPALPARLHAWLAQRFELARGAAGANLLAMEGLRGFAVFLVFVVHYATLVAPWLEPGSTVASLLDGAHSIGHAGVDLFFVLSGYLIYGHLVASHPPFLRYFARRVQRIYPAFLAVLAVYLVLSALRPGDSKIPHDPADATLYVLQNLLLLPGILPIEPIITVAWSLSYEMFYYLAMPILLALFGLRRRGAAWRFGFFLLLTLTALAAASQLGGPMRLIMFLAGVLLYEALGRWPQRAPGSAAAWIATAACLGALLVPMPGAAGQTLRVALLGAGFFVLCAACFARPEAAVSRAFCWTPLRWLGNMSYSYYLVHGLSLKVFFTLLALAVPPQADGRFGLELLLPAFLFTLPPSAMLFMLVERPFSLAPAKRRGSETAAAEPARS